MYNEYLQVNRKFLCNVKDYVAGILLAELQERCKHFKIGDGLDEQGYFALNGKDIRKTLGLTNYKFSKAKNKLVKEKYIKSVLKGTPAKLYVKLNNYKKG